jgi:hypothetical protein
MRKVYVTLTVNLILSADDDLNLDKYIEGSELKLVCDDRNHAHKADVLDLTIENVEVTDSK